MLSQIRLYIEIGAAAVLLIAFGLFVHHERTVGAEHITQADAKAQDAARKQADAETQLNLAKAAKADEVASSAQKAVDDYRTAHPEQPIRLCYSSDSVPGLPQVSPGDLKLKNSPTRSAALPEVPGRSEGPDIAPELNAIVQAAQRLDILYAERQQR